MMSLLSRDVLQIAQSYMHLVLRLMVLPIQHSIAPFVVLLCNADGCAWHKTCEQKQS